MHLVKMAVSDNAAPCGEKWKVLVVDDEPIVLNVTSAILRKAGYYVVSAPNGEAAIQILEEMRKELNLVVTDVCMPGMSGIDLAEFIGDSPHPIPIILMSGYSEPKPLIESLKDRGKLREYTFLQKPFRMQLLLDLAGTALGDMNP